MTQAADSVCAESVVITTDFCFQTPLMKNVEPFDLFLDLPSRSCLAAEARADPGADA